MDLVLKYLQAYGTLVVVLSETLEHPETVDDMPADDLYDLAARAPQPTILKQGTKETVTAYLNARRNLPRTLTCIQLSLFLEYWRSPHDTPSIFARTVERHLLICPACRTKANTREDALHEPVYASPH